ncbi:putative 2-dehydropantoate 2-reductase [Pestalotiopsis sp. NC0098]|nr:putative 2-dehydropantoate 2-reductase [Pestalotiopsis sp. NC0098]
MADTKARVLVVGSGGVGTLAAYALETGGKATVTAVFRSNYDAVVKNGITIDSIQHGHDIKGWKPSEVRNSVPDVEKEGLQPFDFILVTMKHIAEVPSSVSDVIRTAVTPGKTAIVLSQNGLNIEKKVVTSFPTNPIISSVSTIGATERSHGDIFHDDVDSQKVGAFTNPGVSFDVADAAARRYIDVYRGTGKVEVIYEPDVLKARWRKLVYNASFNSVATVLQTDVSRLRMTRHAIDDLVKPIMYEIIAGAKAYGVELASDLPDQVILQDEIDWYFKPSMCQDILKDNLIESEVIVGEPLRDAEAKGVEMPTLKVVYGLLKVLQKQTLEKKGLWEPKFAEDNPYKG